MKLNVRTWGSSAHPVCLVLHGITSNAGSWVQAGPALASLGLYVVAPELRGHGDSPHEEPYDTRTLISDLVESAPTDPVLLVGHSFGGFLAQQAVLTGQFTPSALLLEDPVSHQPNAEVPTAMLSADETGIPRSVDGILANEPRWSRVDAAWKLLSLEQVDWNGARSAFAGNAPWDLRPHAAELNAMVTTTWLLPEKSRFVPEMDLSELRSAVGNHRIVIAEDSGHSVHRDRLDLFLRTATELIQEIGITE